MAFKKGDPNINRKGRPEFSLITILKRQLQEVPEGEKVTNAELLIRKIINDSKTSKDISAAREVLDRVEGKAKQSVDTNLTINQSISKIIDDIDDTTNKETTE